MYISDVLGLLKDNYLFLNLVKNETQPFLVFAHSIVEVSYSVKFLYFY